MICVKCKEYYVDMGDLKLLLKACEKAMESPQKAKKVLPCVSGFFFGSGDYDDYYYDDVLQTIKVLTRIVENEKKYRGFNFYYSSSW